MIKFPTDIITYNVTRWGGMSDELSHKRFVKSVDVHGKQTYIIGNFKFWCDNGEELIKWLATNTLAGADTLQKLTLCFANEQEEMMFLLRWDGPKL